MQFESNRKKILGIVAQPSVLDCSQASLSRQEIREAKAIFDNYFNHILIEHRDSRGYLPDLNNLQDIASLDNWNYDFSDKIKIINSFVTDQDTIIENEPVQAGSWLLELEIIDPEIQKAVDEGVLTGLSYGGAGILASMNSHQVIMDLLPAEISLVKNPCNRLSWLRKFEAIQKNPPFENERACRLEDPKKYTDYRRGSRTHQGKEYSIVFGRNEEGKLEEQAYRYNKDIWTSKQSEKHCLDHQGKFEDIKEE